MNDTVSGQVRDYVLQVRAALADLPAEDVEEFTTGMEADLAERLAEPGEGTLRDRLGEPEAYAAELRSAAGLPPRGALGEPKKPVAQRLSDWWAGLSSSLLTAMPWLRDLRPVWWALRGVALATIPALILGLAIMWLGLLGAIASIAAGLLARNGKLTGGWVGPVRVIGNATAGLLLPFAFVLFVDGPSYDETAYSDPYAGSGEGISYLGEPVANVYAYDETGRRLDKVRLYDQNGRALGISPESVMYGPLDPTGAIDPQTGQVTAELNVFPLRWPGHDAWLKYNEWEPPLAITPLPGPVPTVELLPNTSAPSPTTAPTPGASVSTSPTATPTAPPTSPSSGVSATPTPTPSASR